MEGYLEVKQGYGELIPEPVPESQAYSGQFRVQILKSLRQRLVIETQREGLSLNQYVLYS
ncbi:MAG: toxin-antitoxin system HicB family antitoxin [Clostridia bacterium]